MCKFKSALLLTATVMCGCVFSDGWSPTKEKREGWNTGVRCREEASHFRADNIVFIEIESSQIPSTYWINLETPDDTNKLIIILKF